MDRCVSLVAIVLMASGAKAAPTPETVELFVGKCASCHSVGAGPRVGPDLKGVTERRNADWLSRMIKAPSGLLDSDADARALLGQFNNVRMPDLGLSEAQVATLVSLLDECSRNTCDLAPKMKPVTQATDADIAMGQALFEGVHRPKNEAPACISCHTVDNVGGVLGGGTLAKNLTTSFARLGEPGLDAALKAPAFPLMNKIFADRPLTGEEVFALRAFLYHANRTQLAEPTNTPQHNASPSLPESPAGGPWNVPLAACLGAISALVVLNALWSRRLRGVRSAIVHPGRPS